MANEKQFFFEGQTYKMPTEKQKKFIFELIDCDLQGPAYQRVYKNVKNEATARANASKLLTNSNVRAYYNMKKAEYWKERHITTDQAVANLASIVKAKITDFIELKANGNFKRIIIKDFDEIPEELHCVIKSVKATDYGIEVQFYDRLKAIEMFLRMQGAFEKDNEQKREQVVFMLPDNKRK